MTPITAYCPHVLSTIRHANCKRELQTGTANALRFGRGSTNVSDERTDFDSLVMPHLADALALARWLTRNRADAEDVVQEACLKAFRSIHSCAGTNPRAWVLTAVA